MLKEFPEVTQRARVRAEGSTLASQLLLLCSLLSQPEMPAEKQQVFLFELKGGLGMVLILHLPDPGLD